ncbi:hypothetical protein PybrP1_010830 [[Pythium] brassicae (nom. inval.)]|nr:hypothetical protein PybrP1_010830 [[Pythium] brassicae (nom. inval.)]
MADENAATTSARVELFQGATRDVDRVRFESLLRASYDEDALHTLKIVAHIRDCRGGKGERRLGRLALVWLAAHHPRELAHNLRALIGEYGRFDDSLVLMGSSVETDMLEMLRKQLVQDQEALGSTNQGGTRHNDTTSNARLISMCAKWIPSQQRKRSDRQDMHKKLCNYMRISSARLRKQYLTPLRCKIATLEKLMSAGEWTAIEFDKVPSVAMQIHGKPGCAFERHLPDRFAAWKAATAELTSGIDSLPRVGVTEPEVALSPLESVLREIERPRYNAIALPALVAQHV